MNHYCKYFLCFSWLFCLSSMPALAQDSTTSPPSSQIETTAQKIDLKVGEVLRVKVPKLPANPSGQIAVLLGSTDITSQVEIEGNELVYRSSLIPLNVGTQTLTVYQKSPNRWKPLATFKIKVEPGSAPAQTATRGGTNTESSPPADATPPATAPTTTPAADATPPATTTTTPPAGTTPPADATPPAKVNIFTPKLAVNVKSQILENRSPDAGSSQRPTFFNIDFNGGLTTENQINNINLKTKFTIVGTTFQPEALRFGELQAAASQVDLSEYAIELNDGTNQFAIGNLCFGNHPLLVNNLCSRGLSAKVKLNDFSDLSLARVSSTAIVGFDNIFGLARNENTLEGVILGLQLARNQNGGVRLETTWMNGNRAPVSNFNVGEVVDAEKSEGVGVRITGNDDTGRLKTDAGFANSTFTTNADNDPELNDGLAVVPLEVASKSAWYAEASYDLIKDLKLDRDRTLSAGINFRTERVDPLFGTLGTNIQADLLQTQYALNLNIAGATAQFQQSLSNNNIASLPNLLRTDNRNTNINLTIPLQTFLQNSNSLLPTVTYGIQQTNQVGSIASAAGGGFNNPAQIPDQANTTQQVGLDWSIGSVNVNYKYISALQDNRQVGQENADTRNLTHQFSTSWQATPQLRFNLGYNFVNANNLEQQITRFTNSPTVGVSWEFKPGTVFAFNYNRSDDSDSIGQAFNRGESLEFLLSWSFKLNSLGREMPGTTFIRYGKQSTLNLNSQNNVNTNATIDTISAGLSLSF
ncbi:hypothetical protein [Chamaesiphon sp. VAR_48_metabat_403]|uniref:hypothetical protein n=1 Tax=Chamaesiphon sp. VAR_48_metabat_403 TaxID=2964700 RepID=UPI00286D7260|nr:hypothetical protein [Chamaesiphon sp. VAR_48_metabat_403]